MPAIKISRIGRHGGNRDPNWSADTLVVVPTYRHSLRSKQGKPDNSIAYESRMPGPLARPDTLLFPPPPPLEKLYRVISGALFDGDPANRMNRRIETGSGQPATGDPPDRPNTIEKSVEKGGSGRFFGPLQVALFWPSSKFCASWK